MKLTKLILGTLAILIVVHYLFDAMIGLILGFMAVALLAAYIDPLN